MKKRFLAFLIDIIIVSLICIIINKIIAPKEVKTLNQKLNIITDNVISGKENINEYLSDYFYLNYKVDKLNVTGEIISYFIIILYFIIIPTFTKGKTFGLKLFKLKISGDLSIKNLFTRNIITTGILIYIFKIILLYIFKYKLYYIIMLILTFVQLILVITSIFMIIYRKDKKGLQDKLSNTYIEEV